MIRLDMVKGGYKVRVVRHGWVIVIKEYGSVAHINFFPLEWKIMYLVLIVFTAILLLRKHCAHFFNSEFNTVNEFWKVFTSFKSLGVISKQEGL